jgi:hypothetical protein
MSYLILPADKTALLVDRFGGVQTRELFLELRRVS